MRIENPRHLPRRRKEILVNERVMVRKKHAKAWMGVVPADDSFLGILLILYGINVFPRILRESHMGAGLFGILALNARGDLNPVIAILSNEHTADLGLAAGTRMLPDQTHNFAIDQQSWLSVRRFRFCLCLHDSSAMRSACFRSQRSQHARRIAVWNVSDLFIS